MYKFADANYQTEPHHAKYAIYQKPNLMHKFHTTLHALAASAELWKERAKTE